MNALSIESFAMTPTLRTTASGFLLGVQAHKDFIAGRHPELQAVLWGYIHEREDAAAHWHHPNLIVPYLMNEFFAVSNIEKLRAICAAYLACDHFTHLLDDLADEKQPGNKAMLAHASHAMLSHGRQLYLGVASDSNGFLEYFERYLEKAMRGEQWLWKRSKNLAPYNGNDFEMLRMRGGMLNICLVAYCDATENWGSWSSLEHAFGEIIVGIQLLDDVVDVERDFLNDIYTMPLAMAISDVGETCAPWESIALHLLKGTHWKEAIALAQGYLERGYTELQQLKLVSTCTALRQIMNATDELAAIIAQSAGVNSKREAAEKIAEILRLPLVRAMSH